MKQINYLEVDTPMGYKSISVYHGDIMAMEKSADILFVSVFSGGLVPLPGTLLGSLKKAGIDARDLHDNKVYDFTQGLNTWLSQSIEDKPFKRILFFEMRGNRELKPDQDEIEMMLENLFLSLLIISKKGIPVRDIVLPVLGTGNQKLDQKKVIPLLLKITERFLNEIENLTTVCFVELDEIKAKSLSNGINRVLGRPKINLDSVKYGKNTRKRLLEKSTYVYEKLMPGEQLFMDLSRAMGNKSTKYHEVGILGRRALEFILKDIDSDHELQLYDLILKARQFGVPLQLISYMHLIRSFGNLSAHFNVEEDTIKPNLNEEDLMINLLALEKVLEFWIKNRGHFTERGVKSNITNSVSIRSATYFVNEMIRLPSPAKNQC